MIEQPEPVLLKATELSDSDIGSCEWDSVHNCELLTVSNNGETIQWGPKKSEYKGKYRPVWVPASTRLHLHSGKFQWDFIVEEMAAGQIGIGFMLLWNVGPDWGFFGYLGASSTAWSYDPSTGDVVCDTLSIQGSLPQFGDGHTGIVSVRLELPRRDEGSASFTVNRVDTQPIPLPEGAVVLPAACLLKETQRVTLARFQRS